MFGLQAVEGILSWRTNTLSADQTPNKAGLAYINLYHHQWRSSQVLTLDQTGTSFRGFRGDYSVIIKKNGQVLNKIEFTLDDNISFKCVNEINSLKCSQQS